MIELEIYGENLQPESTKYTSTLKTNFLGRKRVVHYKDLVNENRNLEDVSIF
jgi:hypothetical protein